MNRAWIVAGLAAWLGASMAASVRAQATLEEATVTTTVGTSVQGTDGRQWAVVFWQPPLGEVRREIAVYRKAGTADAAGSYTLIGRILPDPTRFVVDGRLKQGALLGDDWAAIDEKLSAYFGEFGIDPALDLPDKVTGISLMMGSDAKLAQAMRTMTRFHPGLAMALGEAFADPNPGSGLFTYELREIPPGAADPDAAAVKITGRVTVDVGNPVVLTAPGPLLETSEPSPRGDLQARLIWQVPDALLRESMLAAGYNVYRVAVPFATARGWDSAPPVTGQLAAAALSEPGSVQRVNGAVPVLPPRRYDAADFTQISGLLATPGASVEDALPDFVPFVIDDNDRHEQGGQAFPKGAEFFYFVTARDLFGRDGASSAGLYVQLCKRIPPLAPVDVTVIQDADFDANGNPLPYFNLTWKPVVSDAEDVIIGYEVYRWLSIQQFTEHANFPLSFRAGQPVVVSGGEAEFTFDDNDSADPNRPQAPADFGTTYYYTVRALTSNGCGGVTHSPHSAPTFIVLRNFKGPDNPTGNLVTTRETVTVIPFGVGPGFSDPVQSGLLRIESSIYFQPGSEPFAETELLLGTTAGGPLVSVLKSVVPVGNNFSQGVVEFPASAVTGMNAIFCRVRSKLGTVAISPPEPLPADFVEGVTRTLIADFQVEQLLSELPKTPGEDTPHVTRLPDGSFAPVKVEFALTPGTEEYRVYRSIDDREETLIAQGLASASEAATFIAEDQATPVNGGRLCYSVQLFDKDQNPSGLAFIDCVRSGARVPVPVPDLKTVSTAGMEAAPQLKLDWFAPTADMDRFLVYAGIEGESGPTSLSADLRDWGTGVVKASVTGRGGDTQVVEFRPFATARLAMGFGTGEGDFTVSVPVSDEKTYHFFVVGLGANGEVSDPSQTRSGAFDAAQTEPPPPGATLPWPARGRPPARTTPYHPAVAAERILQGGFDGFGVRIGEFKDLLQSDGQPWDQGEVQVLPGPVVQPEPTAWFYPDPETQEKRANAFLDGAGSEAMHYMLHRRQVSNALYPNVTGNLIQVSPLVRGMVVQEQTFPSFDDPVFSEDDPFFALKSDPATQTTGIYLLDTTPMSSGARYQYYLTIFDPKTGEIRAVYSLNAVDVP